MKHAELGRFFEPSTADIARCLNQQQQKQKIPSGKQHIKRVKQHIKRTMNESIYCPCKKKQKRSIASHVFCAPIILYPRKQLRLMELNGLSYTWPFRRHGNHWRNHWRFWRSCHGQRYARYCFLWERRETKKATMMMMMMMMIVIVELICSFQPKIKDQTLLRRDKVYNAVFE